MKPSNHRLIWIAAQLAVGAVGLAAFAMNGSPWMGIAVFALMLASVVAFEVARRRGLPIAAKVTGVGDERDRSLYREANARTGEWMAYVIAIGGVWVVAEGRDDTSFVGIAVAYAVLWAFNVGRTLLADRRSGLGTAD